MNETWWINPNQLDDKQREVLLEAPETEMFIMGPPGSGKTNILVLRANYVRSVAPRLALLTFTRTLTEFLRSGPNIGRGDQIQREEIQTFMGFAKKLICDLGEQIPASSGAFDVDRAAINRTLLDTITARQVGKLYDVVFIDEAQSFLRQELQIIRAISDRVNAAGDIRQKFSRHNEGIPTVVSMVEKTIELTEHYRIGEKICEFADRIRPPNAGTPPMLEGSNYKEAERPSSVTAIACGGEADEFARCIEFIRTQRRYITDEPIGVLTITTEMRDRFWEALSRDRELAPVALIQRNEEYQPFGPDSLVRVMTAVSAQGSEFRAVHLLGAEGYRANMRELAFTAVTRAKTELHLYHVAPLPGHMIPPANELRSINDIF